MATFGYTSEGSSGPAGLSNGNALCVRGTPASSGTVSKISAYVSGNGLYYKGLVTTQNDHTLIANGIGAASAVIGSSLAWKDSTFGTAPSVTGGTEYEAGFVVNGSVYIAYDTGGSSTTWYHSSNNYTSPTSPTGGTYDAFGNTKCSIYATYEEEAAGSSIKTINGLAKASVKTVNGLAIASTKTWNGLA